MKTNFKCMTGLLLVLLMTSSLLASCSGGGDDPAVTEADDLTESYVLSGLGTV